MTTQNTTPKTKTQQNHEYYIKSKSNVFSLRLNDETAALFNEMARTTDKGKSELIRAILESATIRIPNPKVTNDVLRELSAIGNNINQLTKAVNAANEANVKTVIGSRLNELHEDLKLIQEKL